VHVVIRLHAPQYPDHFADNKSATHTAVSGRTVASDIADAHRLTFLKEPDDRRCSRPVTITESPPRPLEKLPCHIFRARPGLRWGDQIVDRRTPETLRSVKATHVDAMQPGSGANREMRAHQEVSNEIISWYALLSAMECRNQQEGETRKHELSGVQ